MLQRSFYQRDANLVARDLLGKLFVHQTPKDRLSGMIVETEAYIGPDDEAAHAYKNLRTARTEVMYREGGYAYIYLIYGMYHCFNVVTNIADKPEVVLIRALAPVEGMDQMKINRRTDKAIQLCNGPGKLCAALEITKAQYGMDLCRDALCIENYQDIAPDAISRSPRINIDYAGQAKDYPWRYFIRDNPCVTKHPYNTL